MNNKTTEETTEEIRIQRGVQERCVLLLLLSNLYTGHRYIPNSLTKLIRLNKLRYTDDTVIITDSAEGLQRLVSLIIIECGTLWMKVNINQTNAMIISRTPGMQANIHVYHQPIEQIRHSNILDAE